MGKVYWRNSPGRKYGNTKQKRYFDLGFAPASIVCGTWIYSSSHQPVSHALNNTAGGPNYSAHSVHP